MEKKTVKRVKTGAFERRFSMARAGFLAGARYATLSAGTFFASKDQREEMRRKILSRQAQWLVSELSELKGSIVKIGQMMALFGEHFLPEEVTAALHTLENSTTALEWPAIERQLRHELGNERLAELDVETTPLGAASLGQVHKAVRKSDGRILCLKIQYPGVASAIDSDLNAMVSLLKMTHLVPITREFNTWLDEVRTMLGREVDYKLELETTRLFHTLLKDDHRFIVPEVFPDYSTDCVLCTSFEEGDSINEKNIRGLSQERRNALGRAIMELCCSEIFIWEKMQTDPNFGNYLLRRDEKHGDKLVLLDFGAIRYFEKPVIAAGREMIRGAWHHDAPRLQRALLTLGFLENAPQRVLDDFASLCFEAIEVLQDPERFPPPPDVLNEKGEYIWGNSDLPKRVMGRAGRNTLSVYFDVPPKEFIFLFRKLLGAYTFLHVIEAEIRGDTLLAPFLPRFEAEDIALMQKLESGGKDGAPAPVY
jgi:predicted unusual protein kinase regulating ubiquinone biosynthesis (AarF/ABC1/UbiB family)